MQNATTLYILVSFMYKLGFLFKHFWIKIDVLVEDILFFSLLRGQLNNELSKLTQNTYKVF